MTYYSIYRSQSEQLAQRLETDCEYRVLRRLPRRQEIWCLSMPVSEPGSRTVIGVIDSETTGLDCERSRMVELALVKLTICNKTGDLLDISPPQSWLEDPGEPLTHEIEALTGLTDADLQGQEFADQQIRKAISDVDLIVAHNASFDLGFLNARFPGLRKPVACSLNEIDWPAHGLTGGRSISGLLTEAGHFQEHAHRAGPDAWALSCLLIRPGAEKRTIAWHLLNRARRPTARVYAAKAPYALKDTLKATGYRWSAPHRAWALEGEPERIANEVAWLTGLHPAIQPRVVSIDWHNRHVA